MSNVTKGTGMHRLLNAAGCDAAVAGNGAWMRYGPQVLVDHSAAARYPLLLANLRTSNGEPLAGVQPTCLLAAGGVRLGLIGVTADTEDWLSFFGLNAEPAPRAHPRIGGVVAPGWRRRDPAPLAPGVTGRPGAGSLPATGCHCRNRRSHPQPAPGRRTSGPGDGGAGRTIRGAPGPARSLLRRRPVGGDAGQRYPCHRRHSPVTRRACRGGGR